jgi:FkbM family methyltransferase
MQIAKLIARDLKQVYSHPYNKQHKVFALWRYIKYLMLKAKGTAKIQLHVWGNRNLFWYKDSKQGTWLLFNYIIDWEEYKLIEHIAKPDSTIVDVGANVGYYTLWASRFNDKGKVYSFEPNDINFQRLSENVNSNPSVKHVVPVKNAVSNKCGTVSMTNELDTLNHIVDDGSITGNGTVEVVCVTLDHFADTNHIEQIDYLKIDVEGFEFEVLSGAQKMLAANRIGIIQVEINNALDNSGHTSQQLLNLFATHGYSLCSYSVDDTRLVKIEYDENRENYFVVSNKLQHLF